MRGWSENVMHSLTHIVLLLRLFQRVFLKAFFLYTFSILQNNISNFYSHTRQNVCVATVQCIKNLIRNKLQSKYWEPLFTKGPNHSLLLLLFCVHHSCFLYNLFDVRFVLAILQWCIICTFCCWEDVPDVYYFLE